MLSKTLIGLIAAGTALLSSQALATTVVSSSFEGTPGVDFTFWGFDGSETDNWSASQSTAQANTGAYSAELYIPRNVDYAKLNVVPATQFSLQSMTSASFSFYLDTVNTALPYLMLRFDCASPGAACDGGTYANKTMLAIMKPSGTFATDTWNEFVIDPFTTSFHLRNDSDGYDVFWDTTLADLYADWGQAMINRISIGIGLAGGNDGTAHKVFVDDLRIDVAAVPLPATLPLLLGGLGVLGLASGKKRRDRTSA